MKLYALKIAKGLLIFAFSSALAVLFVFGNYLMIGGHRPDHEVLSKGFDYPIPGKGGAIYVSQWDLIILSVLVAVFTISVVGANWVSKLIPRITRS